MTWLLQEMILQVSTLFSISLVSILRWKIWALSAIFLGLRLPHPLMDTIFPKLNMLLIFSLKPVSQTTRLFPLLWNLMPSSHPWMVNLYQMLLVIVSWLVVWSILLSLALIFHMPWVWLVNSWTPFVLSTMLLFFEFSDTSRVHFIMVFTTPLDLFLSFMLIQMWIGPVIWMIDTPSQVFVSCWVLLLSHGVARSRTWFPIPVPRLSIMLLSTPLVSLSGFNGS